MALADGSNIRGSAEDTIFRLVYTANLGLRPYEVVARLRSEAMEGATVDLPRATRYYG
jgi:hypothetical protein